MNAVNAALFESRKWFQAVVALASLGIVAACLWSVHASLPAQAEAAKLALLVLGWAAFYGLDRFLMLFLPIVVLKVWPRLESPRSMS